MITEIFKIEKLLYQFSFLTPKIQSETKLLQDTEKENATVYGGIVFMIAQNVGRLPNSAEKSKKFEKSVAKPLTFQA